VGYRGPCSCHAAEPRSADLVAPALDRLCAHSARGADDVVLTADGDGRDRASRVDRRAISAQIDAADGSGGADRTVVALEDEHVDRRGIHSSAVS